MKLTSHGAMIKTQSYLRASQGASQWRTMCSGAWPCSLSLIRIKFSLNTSRYVGGSNKEARVHYSLVHSPHLVSCREWLGRKVGQSRCGVSSTAGVGIVGNAKSQVWAAQKIGYEELGRYGIGESDYAIVMTSPQRPQSCDKYGKSSSNAVFKGEEGFALKQKINLEETEDIQATESSEDARVEGNDWCTYLILSNDKRKTYLGVTANLSRRLRQHNGELAGGSKAARGGRPWSLVCTVRGFGTRSEACQFEWRLRKFSKGYLKVHETISEEIPSHYQGSHVILRRWAAFKRVYETTDDWKHVRVEWH